MRTELVSMIVPIYNAEAYIERCVDSICSQTYQNIEIILVDDGSVDNSCRLCKEKSSSDSRIRVLHQSNQGVVSARNTGIDASNGKYLMFVDADDWIEPDMVEELLRGISDADIISSGVFWEKYFEKEVDYRDEFTEGLYASQDKKKYFLERMIFDIDAQKIQPFTPCMWNKMYKRELVMEVYRSFDRTIGFAEDTLFVYKCMFRAESFVITHKQFYHYTYNEKSVCHTVRKDVLLDINKVYLALFDECKSLGILKQMQMWIAAMIREAVNIRMEFDISGIQFLEFLLDTRMLDISTKRVVLYGAGKMGKDFRHQLKKLGYEIVLWVDSNYEYWEKLGYEVSDPEVICEEEYDEILIAVSDQNSASAIRKYLLTLGVENRRIKWHEPIVL